jgi:hypothetical protein
LTYNERLHSFYEEFVVVVVVVVVVVIIIIIIIIIIITIITVNVHVLPLKADPSSYSAG